MSKYPCHVVKDLLPNYIDGVCSDDTVSVIEEHINGCPECKALYESMKEELPGLPDVSINKTENEPINKGCSSEEEKKILQKVNDRIVKKNRKNKIITIAVCAAVVIMFLLSVLPIRQIPAKNVDIIINSMELDFPLGLDIEHGAAAFNAGWPENTLFFFEEGKNIDDCSFMKGISEDFPDITFAIDTGYFSSWKESFNINAIMITSDYPIKSYSVEYLKENGKTVFNLKDARTTLFAKPDEDVVSNIRLFYVERIDGMKLYGLSGAELAKQK